MRLTELICLGKPWRRELFSLTLLTLADSLLTLALPLLAGAMVGGLFESDAGQPPLPLLVGSILAVLAALALLRIVSGLLSAVISQQLLAGLRSRIHDHLVGLAMPFHEAHGQGDLLALTTWEIDRLSNFLTGTLVNLLPLLLTAAGSVVLMFRIDPQLALVVPILVPGFYLVLKLVGRRLRRLSERWQKADAEVIARAEMHLELVPAIKSFTRESTAGRQFAAAARESSDAGMRQLKLAAVLAPVTQFVAASAAVVLLLFAGLGVRNGAMTTPELVSFLLYAAMLTRPVAQLSSVYGQLQSVRGTLARLGRVLAVPVEPLTRGRPLDRARGELTFDNVCFTYPERTTTLDGVSLSISAGETIAITGPNGAGKSTLVSLLLRYRSPDAGRILLDDLPIEALRLADLRRQIGLVPQRPLLFNGTIAENIGFGMPEAARADIVTAAKLAQAHEFVAALPLGYETVIGDHGVRLSGGQGQRVALARALIKDPPLLILDEATSMFDLEGESDFIMAARGALRGRTVILITHRPAMLALADRIVRLDKGRLFLPETRSA